MNDVERGHITALAQMNSTRRMKIIVRLGMALVFAGLIWAVVIPNYSGSRGSQIVAIVEGIERQPESFFLRPRHY